MSLTQKSGKKRVFVQALVTFFLKAKLTVTQGNRIWDAPPSALPGANLLKRLLNISK